MSGQAAARPLRSTGCLRGSAEGGLVCVQRHTFKSSNSNLRERVAASGRNPSAVMPEGGKGEGVCDCGGGGNGGVREYSSLTTILHLLWWVMGLVRFGSVWSGRVCQRHTLLHDRPFLDSEMQT